MDLASWTLGLSLIVLTIVIQTTAVVMMAFGLETRIRVEVDNHKHDPRRAIPIVISHIGAVGLVLAALHGLQGVLWARHIGWLGAFGSFTDASVYSLGTMTTFEIPGCVAIPMADARRARGGERRPAVRHQHGVHFRGDSGVLAEVAPRLMVECASRRWK